MKSKKYRIPVLVLGLFLLIGLMGFLSITDIPKAIWIRMNYIGNSNRFQKPEDIEKMLGLPPKPAQALANHREDMRIKNGPSDEKKSTSFQDQLEKGQLDQGLLKWFKDQAAAKYDWSSHQLTVSEVHLLLNHTDAPSNTVSGPDLTFYNHDEVDIGYAEYEIYFVFDDYGILQDVNVLRFKRRQGLPTW